MSSQGVGKVSDDGCMSYEQTVLVASRSVIDAHAEHLHAIGRRLLLAAELGDLDEIRFVANDLIGYGEHTSDSRFNNAIANLGSDT